MRYFYLYLAAINLLTFCVYGADKRRAKLSGARRVPEKTLLHSRCCSAARVLFSQ